MEINRFRTQLGGFHRVDVANYIEKTAREHLEQMQRVKDDCAKLCAERDDALQQLEAVKAQLAAALEGKELPAEPAGDPETLELAAYRRAEAAERAALSRIRRQTEKMDGILRSVGSDFSAAKQDVEELAQKLAAVLDTLEESFRKTARNMETLKEITEE